MSPALNPTSNQPLDIVVVDDNSDDLKWMSRITKKLAHHCTVHTVQDSVALESTLLDFTPAVVFVDYHLGKENGVNVIRQFHRHYPDTAFVLITGLGSEKIMAEAIRAGASDFLRKEEITSALLDDLIERVLQSIFQHSYARLALTVLNEGIITTDADRQILRCNPAFESLLEEDEKELVGRQLEKFFHPDDEELVRTLFSLSDSLWDSPPQLRLKTSADTHTLVSMNVNSLVAAGNKNYVVILRDIYASDAGLKPIDKQLAIIHATSDLIGYCNRDGEIQFLNPSARIVLGIKRLELEERITLFDLFAPMPQGSFATTVSAELDSTGHYTGEGLINGKTRENIPVSIVINGIKDASGRLETITFILREIQSLH